MESKWQKKWEEDGVYHAHDSSELSATSYPLPAKFYGLIEFPYPSGEGLHVGHPRPYIAIDVVTRKHRMEGKNVLYPIGWDAFGLPTENFAIKNKIPPEEATKKNIANFRRQIKMLGFGFDWSREIDTTDPKYYKWTQWQFLQFVKAGLAYKSTSTINWCPKCKIGLANEEAQGGVCERCGTPVEKREKAQWMLKITKYAERLLKDLDHVDYLDKIKAQQVNWIGKSEGAEVKFEIQTQNPSLIREGQGWISDSSVAVFTTRPDTLFGATYLVLAPDHARVDAWLASAAIKNKEDVEAYRDATKRKSDLERTSEEKEKTGVVLDGVSAMNPATGESIPVWISDYVLANYGTGAIMAVPAHDERDFAFAKKFGLEIKQVVIPDRTLDGIGCILMTRDGNILLQRRSKETNRYPDKLTPFGGGLENNETAIEAVIRELKEELELTVSLKDLVWIGDKESHFNPGKLLRLFVVRNVDEKNLVLHEGQRIEKLSPKEALASDEVTDFTKQVLQMDLNESAFVGEGIAINSDFLNGLSTADATQKMIAWLEEKKIGKRMTTYRLRDWVFSRQRYWGEPIPLVHCDTCAKKKQKALIIHGLGANPEQNWYPRMKQTLEENGFEVFAPAMTTTFAPSLETWLDELKPYIDQMGEDDVVIAHSMGGKVALHLLERAQKKIGQLFLVAPLVGPISEENWEERKKRPSKKNYEMAKKLWEAPVSLEKVGALVYSKNVFWSSDDTHVPEPTHEIYPAGWNIVCLGAYGHINDPESPELVERVLMSKLTGWIPLPEDQLPLTLPKVDAYEPTDTGESPLAKIESWVKTTCPRCGGPATRETDTMPNWAGSSWYFLRYCDPKNDKEFASAEKLRYWMPVDLYNGGMEHTTLHLLYSRFWYKFLFDMGYIPKECGSEPYRARRSQGMILGEGGIKMSKSKGNVINPDDVVGQFGSDVFRVYEMFIGPYDQSAPWDTNGIEGVKRFLEKVWNVFASDSPPPQGGVRGGGVTASSELDALYHQTIKKITDHIDHLEFNTCVSQLMILTNAYQDVGGIPEAHRDGFLQVFAPFAPHIAEEIWHLIGHTDSIHQSAWPTYDAAKLQAATFELVIQVNGKVRGKIVVDSDIAEEEAKEKALASEAVQKFLEGRAPKKVIYVAGRLVNICP